MGQFMAIVALILAFFSYRHTVCRLTLPLRTTIPLLAIAYTDL
ncbi:Uncharacterised protein [Escherichia coli]|uniref:Uncharacterized protein n=1 Tax=Escherichia coli TaxID=562 RepID=A0A376IYM6_ECOLX|nr:Uncharacterised protein [Escherichia coli]